MVGIVIGSLLIIGVLFLSDKMDDWFGRRDAKIIKVLVGVLGAALVIIFLRMRYEG